MSNPANVASLKSDTVGMLLYVYLCLGLAVDAIALLCYVVHLVAPDLYQSIAIFAHILFLAESPMWVVAVILFLVWMFLLHRDLKFLFRPYPITSGEALAQLMIPFYNIWGIWNVFATLADILKRQGGKLAEEGSTLRFWLPVLYVVSIASRIVDRILVMQERLNKQTDSSTLILASLGLGVVLSGVWLAMAGLIRRAARYRFTEIHLNMAERTIDV